MGQSGAVAMLILLFLAVTSACSAEQIAVSSLFAYDVYGVYINPKATDKQLLWTGRAAIVGCAIMMGVFATVFHYIGVSMGYLYELMVSARTIFPSHTGKLLQHCAEEEEVEEAAADS